MSTIATRRIAVDMRNKQKNFRFSEPFARALEEAAAKDRRTITNWIETRCLPILEAELGRPIDLPSKRKEGGE